MGVSLRTIFVTFSAGLVLVVVLTSLVPTVVFWLSSLHTLSAESQNTIDLHVKFYRERTLDSALSSLQQSFIETVRIATVPVSHFAETPELLYNSSNTASSLLPVLYPIFMSLPIIPYVHRVVLAWESRDGCQHTFHRTFTTLIYGIWDGCVSATPLVFNYNHTPATHIPLPASYSTIDPRVWWYKAHDEALVRDGLVWTPFKSVQATDGKLVSLSKVNPKEANISNRVSFISYVSLQTEALQRYLTGVNKTQKSIAFLTEGNDYKMLLIAGSDSTIVSQTGSDVLAWNCSHETTREAVNLWISNGHLPSFSLTTDSNLLVDNRELQIPGGGGLIYRLFLITDRSEFLEDILQANKEADDRATTTVAAVMGVEMAILICVLLVSIVVAIVLSRPLKKVCAQISSVANMQIHYSSNGNLRMATPTPTTHLVKTKHTHHNKGCWKSMEHCITEIQQLQEQADRMNETMESFGKFVPVAVVQHLLKHKLTATVGMTKTTAAVMFLDIVNFTHTMEDQGVQIMMDILSTMFERFSQVINANEGIIDKWMGDAIMALWNVPDPIVNPVHKAVKTVAEILEALEELNETVFTPKMGGLKMKVRIGLTFGEMFVGNVGSHDRLNYTVIGNTVNLASRLEQLNKHFGTSVLVCDAIRTDREVLMDDSLVFRCLGYSHIRGFAVPVRIHELVGRRGKLDVNQLAMLTRYETVDKAFIGNVSSLSPLIRDYLDCYPGDQAIQQTYKFMCNWVDHHNNNNNNHNNTTATMTELTAHSLASECLTYSNEGTPVTAPCVLGSPPTLETYHPSSGTSAAVGGGTWTAAISPLTKLELAQPDSTQPHDH